jgi:anti-sigma regulatory factor (Ser/Thr protein kinase)
MSTFETAGENRMEMHLEATAAAVPQARRAVGAFAEQHGLDRDSVELAVTEAVANAVVHGFPDGVPGEVVIRAWAPLDQLRVDVSDDGVGMQRNPRSPGLGLGLRLITTVTEKVTVGRSGTGGALVSMRFVVAH